MAGYNHIHLEELEELAKGNSQFMTRMLSACCQQLPGLLDQLEAALRDHDVELIKRTSHRMAPTFHYLGRKDLGEVLEALENYTEPESVLNEKAATLLAEARHVLSDACEALKTIQQ